MKLSTIKYNSINEFGNYKISQLKKLFPNTDKKIEDWEQYANATDLVKTIWGGSLSNFTRRQVVVDLIKKHPKMILQFKGSKPSLIHESLLPALVASFDENYLINQSMSIYKACTQKAKDIKDEGIDEEVLLELDKSFTFANSVEDNKRLLGKIRKGEIDTKKLLLVLKISTDFSYKNIVNKLKEI